MVKLKSKINSFTTIEMLFVLMISCLCMSYTSYRIPKLSLLEYESNLIRDRLLKIQENCILNNSNFEIILENDQFDDIKLESLIDGDSIYINQKGNVDKAQSIGITDGVNNYQIKIWIGCGRSMLNEN